MSLLAGVSELLLEVEETGRSIPEFVVALIGVVVGGGIAAITGVWVNRRAHIRQARSRLLSVELPDLMVYVGDENWPPGHTLAQPPPTELRPLVVRLQAAAVSAGSREAELADDIYQALAKLQTIYDDQPDVDQWDRAATERVEALTETWWQAAHTLESHVRKKAL